MNKIKLTIFFLLLLIPFFIFAQATKTEIQYPTVPGALTPTATTTFPEYVKYLFNLSVIIAGVIALGVMIWGGISYITSAGDPNVISEAKNKILGAFLGLIILLSSYLVLLTINPQLLGLKMQPIKPVTGVYLINAAGEKLYVSQDTQKLLSGFNATSTEFISTSTELASVFVYSQENYQGIKQEIINTGPGPFLLTPTPRSIYFLKNMPGIYLYDRLNFQLSASAPFPFYTSVPISDLNNVKAGGFNYNDKTQSLKYIHPNPIFDKYGVVLFTDTKFQGKCAISWGGANVSDLSSTTIFGYVYQPIGNNNLSSIFPIRSKWGAATSTASVIFYDAEDCKGNSKEIIPLNLGLTVFQRIQAISAASGFPLCWNDLGAPCVFDTASTTQLYENIRSFRINGNFAVLLSTQYEARGDCELFFEKPEPCDVPTLHGTTIHDSWPTILGGKRVRSFMIISTER